MSKVESLIIDIQECVFDCQPETLDQSIVQLVDELSKYISQDNLSFSIVLSKILEAYENKDYLLFADLLKYELLPLLQILRPEGEMNNE